jgi:hypothetical protein
VLDGIRGEPTQPADPATALVWQSIERLSDYIGAEDAFIRSSEIARDELLTHPMTLGLGRGLRRQLESSGHTVGEVAVTLGFASFTGMDEGFVLDEATPVRKGLGPVSSQFVTERQRATGSFTLARQRSPLTMRSFVHFL